MSELQDRPAGSDDAQAVPADFRRWVEETARENGFDKFAAAFIRDHLSVRASRFITEREVADAVQQRVVPRLAEELWRLSQPSQNE